MKTSEAWTMLADTLETYGMPVDNKENTRYKGLCNCITAMWLDDIIPYKQKRQMHMQLIDRFDNGKTYFWPPGKVKPRIEACRILAELSE